MVLEQLYIYVGGENFFKESQPFLHTIYLKKKTWNESDLNTKAKTIKLLQENIWKIFEVDKYFLEHKI